MTYAYFVDHRTVQLQFPSPPMPKGDPVALNKGWLTPKEAELIRQAMAKRQPRARG